MGGLVLAGSFAVFGFPAIILAETSGTAGSDRKSIYDLISKSRFNGNAVILTQFCIAIRGAGFGDHLRIGKGPAGTAFPAEGRSFFQVKKNIAII